MDPKYFVILLLMFCDKYLPLVLQHLGLRFRGQHPVRFGRGDLIFVYEAGKSSYFGSLKRNIPNKRDPNLIKTDHPLLACLNYIHLKVFIRLDYFTIRSNVALCKLLSGSYSEISRINVSPLIYSSRGIDHRISEYDTRSKSAVSTLKCAFMCHLCTYFK